MPKKCAARQLIPQFYRAGVQRGCVRPLRSPFIRVDIPQVPIEMQLRQGLAIAILDLLSRTCGVSAFQLRSTLR